MVTRSEVEINFRKYIIANTAGIVKKASAEIKLATASSLIEALKEVDNADIQEPLGKTLAKIQFFAV